MKQFKELLACLTDGQLGITYHCLSEFLSDYYSSGAVGNPDDALECLDNCFDEEDIRRATETPETPD